MPNVAMIYLMYGHVDKLASSLQASVTPILPIATPGLLKDAVGILLGIPTLFGMLPAQVKGLFDACGGLWHRQALRYLLQLKPSGSEELPPRATPAARSAHCRIA
ncbi:hypothetical protein PF010_g26297 [Phytophthora fragariae]|uniref:Uncharacterized protein n=1 Tax=Phytophthora fragariae TaxID=53985 RepID=A0A6A3KPQ7_9STRA|nr:hypothetical protein PF003_g23681 [Phytophthora fragariae]KAE8945932.1 hypothetical protein PF009_g4402 [Phytophthora fragariae]KAE9009281.1 hypothetical protein PF011_g10334 [Phytophthora fragariae]KAE9070384.1 hypothetical protein PF010_g26297 [Phytophthora fragariae]KAE9106683.1 hypothetical protein PF006_g21309 [Phytophthora fragariae]